jgi:hypothetical protein
MRFEGFKDADVAMLLGGKYLPSLQIVYRNNEVFLKLTLLINITNIQAAPPGMERKI